MKRHKRVFSLAAVMVILLATSIGVAYGFYSGILIVIPAEYSSALAALSQKQQDLTAAQAELNDIQAQITAAQQKHASLISGEVAEQTAKAQTELEAQITAKQKEVYATKIKYHDYLQGQMIRARGQTAIDMYKENYPFIVDPNLDSLTQQAKSAYEKTQADLRVLQSELEELKQTQALAAETIQNLEAQLPQLESRKKDLAERIVQLEKDITDLKTKVEQSKHWTQKIQWKSE